MNLLIGAATIGLILAPLALGVFLSYRVYHVLDLTADGAFGVGAAVVAALLVRHVPPAAATGAAAAAGVVAGGITGLLHTRLKVSALLAGVLTSTALYSAILFIMGGGTLSLASTESLLTWAARLGQRGFGLPDTVTLLGTEVPGARLTDLALITLLVGALAVGLTRFLRTEVGLAMRATGNSPHMAKAVGIEVDRMLVVGLGVSNGLIAFAGALFAQYQAFASIDMGIGAVVTGVATLMVGETLLGKRPLGRWIAGAVVGALVFRLLLALAVSAGLNPNALKLVTALFVLAVLVAPQLERSSAHAAARGASSRG